MVQRWVKIFCSYFTPILLLLRSCSALNLLLLFSYSALTLLLFGFPCFIGFGWFYYTRLCRVPKLYRLIFEKKDKMVTDGRTEWVTSTLLELLTTAKNWGNGNVSRLAVLVGSSDRTKIVTVKLQRLAVTWSLYKTAIYSCCSQVMSTAQLQLR